MQSRLSIIWAELRDHAPFTLFGSVTGIICMLLFRNLPHDTSRMMFYVFHPGHVFLSAIVTASMFQFYSKKQRLVYVFVVGIIGSIGVGTLSDSLIPYAGEIMLHMRINPHAHGVEAVDQHEEETGHTHEYAEETGHENFVHKAHIGFIEAWYVVFPAALAGVFIAYFRPKTKFPHAGHVLLSMWASSFHMIMAMGANISLLKIAGSFGFLFLAVWLPCCFSDIVFPLLFVKTGEQMPHCHHCHH